MIVAYLMAGHTGTSYVTTRERVVGLVFGTIGSFFFMSFGECSPELGC